MQDPVVGSAAHLEVRLADVILNDSGNLLYYYIFKNYILNDSGNSVGDIM